MRKALGVWFLAACLASGCAGEERPEERPRNGLIAAPSEQGIQLLTEDGTVVRVLRGAKRASEPAWSADGEQIAYSAGTGISTMRPDGSDRRLVVENASHPTWSPDGKRLAFMRDVCEERDDYWRCILELDNPYDLFTVDADGGRMRPLSSDPDFDGYPVWSPDGEWIAFECGDYALCVARPDGTDRRRIPGGRDLENPSWSPDSETLVAAWSAPIPGREGYDIVELDVDSGERRVVAERLGMDFAPASSPDGERLAFLANSTCLRTGECTAHEPWEVWVMDADGENARRITAGGFGPPAWGPAGQERPAE